MESLLSKPHFINSLVLYIIAKQDDDLYSVDTEKVWKKIIGILRRLLNQSLMYNYDSNDDTEATLYFSSNTSHYSGAEKNVSPNTLGEMIKWFPEFALEQIRKYVNFSTFLVETIPPNNDSDVELRADNRVQTWMAFNHKNRLLLKPLDANTKGALLKRVVSVLHYPTVWIRI